MSDPFYFPVDDPNARITSGFGSRIAPIPGASTFHNGIDIAAPFGTEVVAPTNLNVTFAGAAKGFGNLIQAVDPATGNTYQFGHLSTMAVTAGQSLLAGAGLGQIGSTGISTGPHLHFGIKDKNGNYIDPASVLNGALKKGTDLLDNAAGKILDKVPGGGIIKGITGIGNGGQSWLDQFQAWLAKSHFWQRVILIVLGMILIGGGIFLLSGGKNIKLALALAKGGAK